MKKLLMLASFAITLAAQAYWTPVQINIAGDLGLPPAADSVSPLRLNAIYGSTANVYGIDVGLFNHCEKEEVSLRAGLVNFSSGYYAGLSVGGFNTDEESAGLFIGLINYSRNLNGLQIGLINIDAESWLPVFPIFNIGKR